MEHLLRYLLYRIIPIHRWGASLQVWGDEQYVVTNCMATEVSLGVPTIRTGHIKVQKSRTIVLDLPFGAA